MQDDAPAIQQLPPEVLTLIFLYAVPSSPCFGIPCGPHPLPVITSTCSQWRRLALDIRTFWDHVDVDADDSNDERSLRLFERTRLWIKRARGVLLHVHFLRNLGTEAHRVAELIPVLLPHAASISSLVFPHGINVHVARPLFAFWRDQAECTLPETLVLKGMFPRELSLCWPTTSQGLANLQLLNLDTETSPTLENLTNLISGSPRLHTLRLRNMTVLFTDSDSDYARGSSLINLPCLRLLDIAGFNFLLLFLLFAMLSPGPLALDFRLQTYGYHTIPDMRRFLERSNITSLYLVNADVHTYSYYAATPPIEWVSHLSQLRILFLSCGRDEGAQLEHLVALTDGKATVLAPNLHTLVLLDSRLSDLTQRRVKCMVEAYSLCRLIFRASPNLDEPSVDGSSEENGIEAPNEHDTGLSGFKEWLGQRVKIVTFEPRHITADPMEEWDTYVQALMSSLDA